MRVRITGLATHYCQMIESNILSNIYISRDSGFVVLCFPFLESCKVLSEYQLATHSM